MKDFIVLILSIIAISLNIFSQEEIKSIEKVEPPFWWAGMEFGELQLMVYGKDIANLEPLVNHSEIKLIDYKKGDSPNYLFLNLDVSTAAVGEFQIQFVRGRQSLTHSYFLLEREDNSAQREGFNSSDVIYLITPDRFVNGDYSNDSVDGMKEAANPSYKGGRHGGDIKGITNSLAYLKDLGITAIWSNPVLENDMEVYSYHGYSTTDYYKIDPRMGSNEDYKNLSSLAALYGIKLIKDIIVNHCGSMHWWADDLPFNDWYNFQGNYQNTSHRREAILDPYAADYDKKMHSQGWFVETMPDLNQNNPFLANYMIQNTIWWIEYAQLGGIRMDTYSYGDKDFLTSMNQRILSEYPNFNIVGEEWAMNPSLISYWQIGKHNADAYPGSAPSMMDFPTQQALVKGLLQKEPMYKEGFAELYRTLANDFVYPDPNNLVIFADNHDMSRVFSQLEENYELWKMAMAYLMVNRGIPKIFYGTEVLMTNPGTDDHGVIRSQFPGGWKDHSSSAFTGKGLKKQQLAAQAYLKLLLNWRKENETIHKGKLKHFSPSYWDGTYTIFRYDEEKTVMLIMNINKEDQNVDLMKFKNEIQTNWSKGKDIINKTDLDLSGTKLKVNAQAALIIEFEN